MIQRGRSSATNVVPLRADAAPPRLTAPAYLTKPERAAFNEVIADSAPRHFVKGDIPLLVSFVQATLAARTCKDAELWAAAIRLQAMLATKLRLTPHSRSGPKATARRMANMTEPSAYDLPNFGLDE